LPIYQGATVLIAQQSDIAYEVVLRAPATDSALLDYYTEQLEHYGGTVRKILSTRNTKIAFPDFQYVIIYVHVIPLNTTESIAVLHVSSNDRKPLVQFIGPPDVLFSAVTMPFAVHVPLGAPVDIAATVKRTTVPQPPVYRGSTQVRLQEEYPMRIVTYDIPASAEVVRQFYDQQLRLDGWTYLIEYANAFDNYGMLQNDAQPAFSINTFIIPLAPDRTIANLVMYISGPGNWRDVPPPPPPEP
jgi:hypothetical protein